MHLSSHLLLFPLFVCHIVAFAHHHNALHHHLLRSCALELPPPHTTAFTTVNRQCPSSSYSGILRVAMSSATRCLRGIDMLMTMLCVVNLALIIDTLTTPHPTHKPTTQPPPPPTSAYLSTIIYCLFNATTLLVILIIRSLPLLFRAADYQSLAASCCGLQLAVQLFLLLPRTLVVLALVAGVLRSRVVLLGGDAAHSVFFLSSALVLFIYSCAVLVLDCQHVQRWSAGLPVPRAAVAGDEVRILGLSMFSGPLWMMEPSTSSRTRGLSELEIERVTTLTTFTAAPRADKRADDDRVEERKAMEVAQTETAVIVQPASEEEQRVAAEPAEEQKHEAIIDPLHYNNPPPRPPSPTPPAPVQPMVSRTMHHAQ